MFLISSIYRVIFRGQTVEPLYSIKPSQSPSSIHQSSPSPCPSSQGGLGTLPPSNQGGQETCPPYSPCSPATTTTSVGDSPGPGTLPPYSPVISNTSVGDSPAPLTESSYLLDSPRSSVLSPESTTSVFSPCAASSMSPGPSVSSSYAVSVASPKSPGKLRIHFFNNILSCWQHFFWWWEVNIFLGAKGGRNISIRSKFFPSTYIFHIEEGVGTENLL